MSINQINNRISWIDMAKGYGILLVIYAHLGVGWDHIWIYTFHIPLFFFLSGYVFSIKDDFKEFIIRKYRSIIVPYFALGIPMLLFELLRNGQENFSLSWCIQLVKGFILQRRMWTLWYIACLFCMNILFYIIVVILKKESKIIVLSIIMTCIGLCYYKYGGKPLFWNADVCLTAISFFALGYMYKNYVTIIDCLLDRKWVKIILLALSITINLVCGMKSLDVSLVGLEMFDSKYGNPFYTYLAAFAGIMCIVIVSKAFVVKPIRYIGENSMLYYAWHQTIFIPIMLKLMSILKIDCILSCEVIGNMTYKCIVTLAIVLAISICNWIIMKVGLGFLVGKTVR